MVFTKRVKLNVFNHNHSVILVVKKSVVDELFYVDGVPLGKVKKGLCSTLGCFLQPFTVGIFTTGANDCFKAMDELIEFWFFVCAGVGHFWFLVEFGFIILQQSLVMQTQEALTVMNQMVGVCVYRVIYIDYIHINRL